MEREEFVKILRKAMIEARVASKVVMNLSFVFGILEAIRDISLGIIEAIEEWRGESAINGNEDYYGTYVIKRISTDIDFLRSSPLRRHMEFANSNDPLFMYPTRKFWNLSLVSEYNHRAIINFFELNTDLRARLDKADEFIKTKAKPINNSPKRPESDEK